MLNVRLGPPLALLGVVCACSSAETNSAYTKLSPDAGIRFNAATIGGEVARKNGCLGLRGSDTIFRPFVFYATPQISTREGRSAIRLGAQTVLEGEMVVAAGQVIPMDDVRGVSEQVTPDVCGKEGVLIRYFVKSKDGDVE